VQEEIVSQLSAIGLTRNEALAYLTLLESDEAEGTTGYEVASRSGIPRSAVYTVLRRLEVQGAAFCTGDKPARYLPTDPKRFIDQVRTTTTTRLERLDRSLATVPKRAQPEPVWVVSRYEEVMGRLESMIRRAERSIAISAWARELERLAPAFDAVADRRLHRVLHSPDHLASPPSGFACWMGDAGSHSDTARWAHKALVVVDGSEAYIGGAEPAADNAGVWTANPSLVDVATNHIILDITLLARATGRDPSADVGPMIRPQLPPATTG